MSWNTCHYPECESWTRRPDGDYCGTHERTIAKQEETALKQSQKRLEMFAKQKEKSKLPRKGIRKVSLKRAEINDEYFKLVDQFKKDNPLCKAQINEYCTKNTDDPHPTRGRGKYLLDVNTWLPVCRSCHIWIGNNHKEAEAKGLVFSRLATQTPII